jgi:hypothetical protein
MAISWEETVRRVDEQLQLAVQRSEESLRNSDFGLTEAEIEALMGECRQNVAAERRKILAQLGAEIFGLSPEQATASNDNHMPPPSETIH